MASLLAEWAVYPWTDAKPHFLKSLLAHQNRYQWGPGGVILFLPRQKHLVEPVAQLEEQRTFNP